MSKSKQKSLVEPARKTTKKAIQQLLITELKKITSKFGLEDEKLLKDLEKESKKLAKKITKGIKDPKTEDTDQPKEGKPEIKVEKPTAQKEVGAAKPIEIKTKETVVKTNGAIPAKSKSVKVTAEKTETAK